MPRPKDRSRLSPLSAPHSRLGASMLAIAAFAVLAAAIPLGAQPPTCIPAGAPDTPPVLTAQYDIQRDAHNSDETWLNYNNKPEIIASGATNGCLTQTAFLQVDVTDVPLDPTTGQPFLSNPIYSQPLYVPNIQVQSPAATGSCDTIGENHCNVVVAATLNGTLFAWNADNHQPLWNRQGLPQDTAVDAVTVGNALWYNDCMGGEGGHASAVPINHNSGAPPLVFAGTVSTPVVDLTALAGHAVMFVSSYCQNPTLQPALAPTWYLHEIDLTTGLDVGVPYQVNQPVNPPTSGPLAVGCTPGSPAISDCIVPGGQSTGTMYLNGAYQNQRPALLEVTDTNVSSYPLVEVAFGALVDNIEGAGSTLQFHGWLAQFLTQPGTCTTSSCGLTPSPSSPTFIHNTSSAGPVIGGNPPCSTSTGHYWMLSGGSVVQASGSSTTLPDEANRCGEAGTFWSSTRGPAAIPGSIGVDIFLTSANGPFQTTPSGTNGQNTGQSVLRFNTEQTGAGAVPSDSFTPHGQQQFATGSPTAANVQSCGPVIALSPASYTPAAYAPCTPALQPPQADSACYYNPNSFGWTYCQTSVEVASNADWDMGTPGVILFQDSSGNWWAISSDKAGYAYMLNPLALGGFQQYDPGNQFPFAVANILAPNLAKNQGPGETTLSADPDRITSMAFYAYCQPGCSAPTGEFYFWPKTSSNPADPLKERLTALQLTTGGVSQTLAGGSFSHCQNGAGTGTADYCTGGSSVDGQWTLSGTGTAFTTQIVPGDSIIACGCAVQAPGSAVSPTSCPIVTAVASDIQLTMSKGFTEYASSATTDCTSLSTITYSGNFTNPSHDSTPPPKDTGYPGGVVEVVSSGVNSADGLLVTVITDKYNYQDVVSNGTLRTEGNIYIYNAIPGGAQLLSPLWTTDSTNATGVTLCGAGCQAFCAAPFALPTVAGGQIFLPTYAVLPSGTAPNTNGGTVPEATVPCPTDTSTQVYYSGLLAYGFKQQ